MKFNLVVIMICCSALSTQAQQVLTIIVITNEEKPLAGATVKWNEEDKIYGRDSLGKITIRNIPNGKQSFTISYVGYKERTIIYNFQIVSDKEIEIELEQSDKQSEGVIVIATRTSRNIGNTPTRV